MSDEMAKAAHMRMLEAEDEVVVFEAALHRIADEGCEDGDYGDGLCGCWPCFAAYVLAEGKLPDQGKAPAREGPGG